jgi:hypothetical protein
MAIYINPQDAVKLGLGYYRCVPGEEMRREVDRAAKKYKATKLQKEFRIKEGNLASLV